LTCRFILAYYLTECIINWTHSSNWEFGIAIVWGWIIIIEALHVFDAKDLFGAEWEKRHLEKRLGRKVE